MLYGVNALGYELHYSPLAEVEVDHVYSTASPRVHATLLHGWHFLFDE